MKHAFSSSLFSGLATAALFLFTANLGLGFFFLFLPTIPIFYAGLSGHTQSAFMSSTIGALAIGLAAGVEVAAIFYLFLGLPAWYIASLALTSRTTTDGQKEWFPLAYAFLHLVLFGVAVIALMTLYYAGEAGGISGVLASHMKQELSSLDEEYSGALEIVITHWSFLVFAMTLWMWVLALYVHGWFAHRLLAYNHKTIRPHLAIKAFAMPNWMLSLLAIAAVASLIGSASMRFLGQCTLVSLMLPYFLLGCTLMHAASKTWPSRRFLLFFTYFMVATLLWPALLLAGIGFIHHIKRLSGASTSTRS